MPDKPIPPFSFSSALLAALILAVILLAAPPASAQDAGPLVVRIMGRAEILSAGTWREAKTGERLARGEALRPVGDGEASVEAAEGRVEVTVRLGGSLTYDGLVDVKSRPWKDGVPFRPVSLETVPGAERAPQFSLPKGEAEVTVVPGQPLRVVAPLIMAAVRGTTFIVRVAADGSSAVSTIEGQVLAVGRNGMAQMVGPGGGAQLTSSQYASFLQESGVSVPGGDWQGLDVSTLERVDAQTFGDMAGSSTAPEAAPSSATSSTATEASTTTSTSTATEASTSTSAASEASTTGASAESASSSAASGATSEASTTASAQTTSGPSASGAPGTTTAGTTGTTTGSTTAGTASSTTGTTTGTTASSTTAGTTGATTGTTAGSTTAGTTGAATGTSTAGSTTAAAGATTGASTAGATAGAGAIGATGATTGAAAATSTAASALGGALAQVAPVVGSVGGMGAAGVASGVMTGDVPQAEPMQEGAALPGLLTIIDPNTGSVETAFTTDENGELTFGVVAVPGQDEVAVTIDDETYVVDLEEAGTGAITIPPEVVIDHANFTSQSTGFQSTATLTPDFFTTYGVTPTLPITWSIFSITNPGPGTFWEHPSNYQNGLTWGPTADGTSAWASNTQPEGTPPTGAVAQLTDVVGSRTVVVRAETTVAGVVYTRDLTVTYGNGPLSVFNGVKNLSIQFANEHNYITFPTGTTVFPAAAGCLGTVDPTTIVPTFGIGATYGAGWTTYTHPVTGVVSGQSTTSKLPTFEQLLAVASYSTLFSHDYPRKGAAKAAGWTMGSIFYGSVSYDNGSNFIFWSIIMSNGALSPRSTTDYEIAYCVY